MKNAYKPLSIALLLFLTTLLNAQEQPETQPKDSSITTEEKRVEFSIGIYADAYYAYDFSEPEDHIHPYFVSSTHHNEFSTNIMMLDFQVNHPLVRMTLRPALGTYMAANYAAEPIAFRNFAEAYAGVNIWKKKNIWLDIGIYATPFCYEPPYSRDNLLYTRSVTVENVPYYVAGLRLTVPISKKMKLLGYLVNGWQQIADVNQHKSAFVQWEYKIANGLLFNWNVYWGREDSYAHPDYRMRWFSDIFVTYDIPHKFSLLATASTGTQRIVDPANPKKRTNHWWYSANVSAQVYFTKEFSLSARAEFYADPDEMLVSAVNPLLSSFRTLGSSLCLNYKFSQYAYARIEGRYMLSDIDVYPKKDGGYTNQNMFLVGSITAWFTKEFYAKRKKKAL